MNDIVPVLLAGGSGTRLWPLSRKSYPKQFLKIIGDKSLFQETALRLKSSKKTKFKPHITLTNSDFRFFIGEQLMDVGIDPGPILIEPQSKNTAPAILSATLFAESQYDDPIIIVAPSDHVISDINKFHEAINKGIKEIQNGRIVTFGILPTRAETAYGYLQLEELNLNEVTKLVNFIEKPDKETAIRMKSNGNYLWNSGIFLFRAKDMVMEFKKYAPDIFVTIQEALKKSKKDLGFVRLDPKAWSKCRNISIDFAIMEEAKNLSVVPISAGWSDLGDWHSVWQEMKPNKSGVSMSSQAYALSCNNTLLRSESGNQIIVGVGLKNIVAIAMQDAVLVANKDMTQDIKEVVNDLNLKKVSQGETSKKDYRPWGWFECLAISDCFQVKKIKVNPGAALSLQSHNYRSEHWVVVEGSAKVTINNEVNLLSKGQSVFVPQRAIHRIENPEKLPTILIEVQIGEYLGEDDIIRYKDIYSRN